MPKFDQELTFLVPYLFDEESRHSNIPKLSSQTSAIPGSEGYESEHAEKDYSQSVSRDASPPPVGSTSSSTRSATSTPCTERKKRKSGGQPASTAAVLEDYLKERKSQSLNNSTKGEDALTRFFLSMAETVKGFPLRDQVDIKSKLFQMVNAVELRMLPCESNESEPRSLLPASEDPKSVPSSAVSFNPQGRPLNSEGIFEKDPYEPSYYNLDHNMAYGGNQLC